MTDFQVPAVDISAYVNGGTAAEKAAVARAIDAACTEVGFIQVLGHGIPVEVRAGLAAAMDEFFALDLEQKKTFRSPPGINRGYSPPKSESLSLSLGLESASRMNDFFEAFNVGATQADYPHAVTDPVNYAPNLWPSAPDAAPGFEPRVSAYFAEARRVATTMTDIFADALGLPEGFFDAYTDHSLDVLRMNNY
ncbi:MAG: 2-oxoglutarate and iron-dependent oxygenase domain-containing protein, partial [Herbiconiux sp.]|nr:2-oxoglutarate and iron-dependent oxygenase domain-containing protein [Herbiconiux sp.]